MVGRCSLCGQSLVRTSEQYACCPNGHGRLHPYGHAGSWSFDWRRARSDDRRAANLYSKALRQYRKVEEKFPYGVLFDPEEFLRNLPPRGSRPAGDQAVRDQPAP